MSNKTKFEYEDKKLIKEQLRCPICKDPLIDPVSANCAPSPHTFCRQCIEKRIQTDPSCPLCGQKVHSQGLMAVSLAIFLEMLDSLLVVCLGCKQAGLKRNIFDSHFNETCPKTYIECSSADVRCSWKGPRDQLEKHLEICVLNVLKPVILNFEAYIEELEDLIDQKNDRIETLLTEKKRREQRERQRMSNKKLMKANQPPFTKQIDIPANILALKQAIDEVNPLSIIQKLDRYRTRIELIIEDNERKHIEIKDLWNENQLLKDRLKQKEKNPKKQLHNQQTYSNNYARQRKNDNSDRTNYTAYYSGLSDTYNPLTRDYHASENAHPTNDRNQNNHLNNDSPQNTYNGSNPVRIFITTNIAGGGNCIATGGETNIAGQNSDNSNLGRNNNNIAGGDHNNIFGGNNNTGNNNNNVTGGSYHSISTSRKNLGPRYHNNSNDADNPAESHNRNSNNNIAGGSGNNIIGGNNNNGVGNNNIAGGNNHVARTSTDDSENIDEPNDLDDIADNEADEFSIDGSAISAADDRRNASVYSGN